jgi:xanthine/uracil permease
MIRLKYGLNDRPPLIETLLFGFQWLAISIPAIIIVGRVVGALQWSDPADQIVYLQKMSFVMGVSLVCQVLWGHRLPLIMGPSTVLLIGVLASQGFPLDTIYTSVILGGLFLSLTSITGLFGRLQRLFTARVVATVLLLVVFTLAPAIMGLLTGKGTGVSPLARLTFAFVMVFSMFVAQRWMKGVWKSTLIIWFLIVGSIAYTLIFPQPADIRQGIHDEVLLSHFFRHLTVGFSFDPGVLISFFFCYLAVSINDLGSIESLKELLEPPDMARRVNRGITMTGFANILSGFLGVVGPVNFSVSPGVIMSSSCASWFTLIPAAVMFLLLSFSPKVLGIVGRVPTVVIGTVLIYILCFQVAAGLALLSKKSEEFRVEDGLIIGLPLILGTLSAFLPETVLKTLPTVLRPLVGNGFVIGVFTSLVLEHLIFPRSSGKR